MPRATDPDLSRPRLKALAAWIRDDLDPDIAQNGPDRLRPDDVLVLHDVFQALRSSTTITALDLRATGIHRAVMEVAGTATRWPGRLADDCDEILLAWTSKFGRLEDLHPFMYGRGGRLEGIASAGEFSRAALLKRWQNTCPDKIAPMRSRRLGDLGFRPGAWWISPLFAYHSGIIDLESTEGGVCFDKNGAYALVLRETGEIEASSENYFTYRCRQGDKGKYRLTAADPKSRGPIRVLRCHSLNSVWGPRAGIRYEGLYKVIGWTVRTAKSNDHIGKQYKTGDILYEVRFERTDTVPMAEVMKHPTASELDDYAEYKRLRRIHRDKHKKGAADKVDVQISGKDAPPIPATGTLVSQLRAPSSKPCASPSRTATSSEPVSLSPNPGHLQPNPNKVSIISSTSPPQVPMSYLGRPSSELLERAHGSTGALHSGSDDSPASERNRPSRASRRSPSVVSERSHYSEIREVVPWIEYDLELISAAPSISTRPNRIQATASAARGALASSKSRKISDSHSDRCVPLERLSTPQTGRLGAKSSGDGILRPGLMGKDSRKSLAGPFLRSRNPLAKLFDGSVEAADLDGSGHVSPAGLHRVAPGNLASNPNSVKDITSASSLEGAPLSPVPVRPGSPSSPLITVTVPGNAMSFLDCYSSLRYNPSSEPCTTEDPPIDVDMGQYEIPRIPSPLQE